MTIYFDKLPINFNYNINIQSPITLKINTPRNQLNRQIPVMAAEC